MAARRTRGPDGREWEVSVRRFRLGWPDSNFDPGNQDDGDLFWIAVNYLVLAPFFWLVLPLVRLIAMAPVELVRGLVSSSRWVEAEASVPATIRIVWRVPKERAAEAAEHVAGRLAVGYDKLAPAYAEFISMTELPGTRDLTA
jgi:hypothetical protein